MLEEKELTDSELKEIVPCSSLKDRTDFRTEFNKLCYKYGITRKIAPYFIAQVAHESGSFHYLKEIASGKEYDTGRKAIMLGNTPQADGDGQKYKGRGYLQVTGKSNYTKFMKWLGGEPDVVSHPEMLERPHLAMLAAIWFWTTNNCNQLALSGDFEELTRKINGGTNGYKDRLDFYNKAKSVFDEV